jgi:hypothetical protein
MWLRRYTTQLLRGSTQMSRKYRNFSIDRDRNLTLYWSQVAKPHCHDFGSNSDESILAGKMLEAAKMSVKTGRAIPLPLRK